MPENNILILRNPDYIPRRPIELVEQGTSIVAEPSAVFVSAYDVRQRCLLLMFLPDKSTPQCIDSELII
jgi:hypothetical protein